MAGHSDAIKAGMNDSMARRPAAANGAAGSAPSNARYQGWRGLGNAGRIRIDRLKSDPDQPRRTFGTEADDRLAESMRTRGQLVPILVRWVPDEDSYVVVDGDRRFRAAKQAGLADLACVVEDGTNPDEVLETQLIANALREDVLPVEQARAWKRLMESQGLDQTQLAEKLGYTPGTINKRVALLSLPESMQASVDAGEVKPETAYFVSTVADPVEQAEMFERARAGKLRRDDAREEAARSRTKPAGKGGATRPGPKGKAKPDTTRVYKAAGGLRIEATRARGIDPAALLTALEAFAAEVRAGMSREG